jgi:hypothetical protein
MIQAFTKFQRIDQCTASPVIVVKSLQDGAGDQEGSDPPAVISDPDFGQIAAHAQ